MTSLLRFIQVLLISLFTLTGHASVTLSIDGSTGVKPLVESLGNAYHNIRQDISFEIGSGLKPDARIHALIDGKIDIAMASHGIDVSYITSKGLLVHKIASVAVVVGVNHSVGVRTLSDHQLCDIYAGKITNWQDIGGTDYPIVAFIRPFSEVDTEVIEAQLACFSKSMVSASIPTMAKSGQMARSISITQGGLGMTTMVRVAQSQGKIIALALNGVSPVAENLLNGKYTLSRDLFLITSSQAEKKVLDFLDFIRSEQGRNTILRNNAVPNVINDSSE